MDANLIVELEGKTSINELLEEPVGALAVELALPIHFQLAVAVRRES